MGSWRPADDHWIAKAFHSKNELIAKLEAENAELKRQVAEGQEAEREFPRWISTKDMANAPIGWYWAAFPGHWTFYRPDAGFRSIDHWGWSTRRDSLWYWGPFEPPSREGGP